MNTDMLNTMIKELEREETTLSNIRNLASLYIVRDHLNSLVSNTVEQELNDILPSYRNYVDIKTRYQRHEVSDEFICMALRSVCKEIAEFIHTLYSCTDMPEERNLIKKMTYI